MSPIIIAEQTIGLRPWGGYSVLYTSPDFTVKLLVIEVGQRISLQYHGQRSERWSVIEGECLATIGDKTFELALAHTYYIQKFANHRLENIGDTPLQIVEVITGPYDENDVVRLEDDYGRIPGDELFD